MNLGRYQLVGKLASGGMAEVFLAKAAGPMGFEKKVVVKRILPHFAEERPFVEMFFAEARLAARLDHPHIVQIFEFGEADGSYFLAMEYIDGLNLRVLLKRVLAAGERLPVALCAKIISAACEGLAYAHELLDTESGTPLRLVHRDISPDNILVSFHGAVKLADFGIAKAANQLHRTKTGVVKGKVAYMPPEQLQKSDEVDARTDLFALGVVLYELICGRRPFEAESEPALILAILNNAPTPVTQHRDDVPEAVQRILARALAKDRDARYASCRELQLDLERYLRTVDDHVGPVDIARWVTRFTSPEDAARRAQMKPPLGPSPDVPSLAAPVHPSHSATTTPDEERTPGRGATRTRTDPRPVEPLAPPPEDTVRTDPQRLHLPLALTGSRRMALGLLGVAVVAVGLGVWKWASPEPEPKLSAAAPVAPAASVAPPVPLPVPPPATAPAPAAEPEPESTLAETADTSDASPDEDTGSTARPPRKKPRLASFRLETSPEGLVRVNGRDQGRSPVTVKDIPSGEVRVEVADPRQGFTKTRTFKLKPGDNGTLRLDVAQGQVSFLVLPYATVVLDGKTLGETPLGPVSIYEGTHVIQLLKDKQTAPVTLKYQVKPGPQRFTYNLNAPREP